MDRFLGERSYQFNKGLFVDVPAVVELLMLSPLLPIPLSPPSSAMVVMSCLEVWLDKLETRSNIPVGGMGTAETQEGRYTECSEEDVEKLQLLPPVAEDRRRSSAGVRLLRSRWWNFSREDEL